jgi:hypothetical protein
VIQIACLSKALPIGSDDKKSKTKNWFSIKHATNARRRKNLKKKSIISVQGLTSSAFSSESKSGGKMDCIFGFPSISCEWWCIVGETE